MEFLQVLKVVWQGSWREGGTRGILYGEVFEAVPCCKCNEMRLVSGFFPGCPVLEGR